MPNFPTHSQFPVARDTDRGRANPAARTASERRRLVADSALFSDLPDRDLEQLFEGAELWRMGAGDTVFERGDPGDHVFYVLSGSVSVEVERAGGGRVMVNVLRNGEIFGEMAVLEDAPRSATVTTLESSEFLAIRPPEFLSLLVAHPAADIRILGTVTNRLRRLTDVLGNLGLTGRR